MPSRFALCKICAGLKDLGVQIIRSVNLQLTDPNQ